jgi:hypothetical protein
MGKKKIVVYTSAMQLTEAGKDPVKDAIMSALFGNKDIPDEILTTMFQGAGVKMLPAYNYARDHYTLALPSGKTGVRDTLSIALIESVIAKDVPHPNGVSVVISYSALMTPEYAVIPYMLQYRGYDVVTKEITILPPGMSLPPPVCIEWPEHGGQCLEWSSPDCEVYALTFTDEGDGIHVKIKYGIYDASDNSLIEEYEEIVPYYYTNVKWDTSYIFAQYKVLDGAGNPQSTLMFWLYEAASNKYPELSGESRNLLYDTFLPVIPIRYKNHDLTQGKYKERELYKTSKVLLDKLAMDIDLLGEKLNENPDIDDIDHAYVVFGVNLQTKVPESLWYVGDFLSSLHVNMQSDEATFFDGLNDPNTASPPVNYYGVGTGTNITEKGLNLSFTYDYIKIQYLPKVIGRVGDATKKFSKRNMHCEDDLFGLMDWDQGILRIDMQVTKTIVKRVTVYGFTCKNTIYHSHAINTTTLDVDYDEDNNNFVVPVLFRLSQAMPLRRRNMLYTDATMLIVNCYDKIKVKWYQSSWFKIVVMIAVIVITIYSGQAWVSDLATALAAGAYATVLMQLAMTAIVAIVAKYAFNMIVKEIGAKWAIYAAIAFTVISIGLQLSGPSKFSMLGSEMTTSQAMLRVSTGLVSSSNSYLAKQGEQYAEEYTEFTKEMETRWEELEEARDLLQNRDDLDPLLFTRTAKLRMVPSEGPDEFYTRCLDLPSYSTYGIHQEIPEFFDQRVYLEKTIPMDLYNQNIRG